MVFDQVAKDLSLIAIVWRERIFHVFIILEQPSNVGICAGELVQDADDHNARPGDMVFPELAPFIVIGQLGSFLRCKRLSEARERRCLPRARR